MRNFKLLIEYDGSAYSGWQRQKNGLSVQGEIEKALEIMTRQKINLTGSGRTDTGVHALGQVANFQCHTALSPEIFKKGLNSLLNKDIVIRNCQEAALSFHARFDVKSKRYSYRILNRNIPCAIGRQYCWWIRSQLDTETMKKGAVHLIGKQNFKAFEGAGSPRKHSIRTVYEAEFRREGEYLIFDIEADGFLRFMVRNIVGTLVLAGLSQLCSDDVKTILLSEDRSKAGKTAPPQGLFLTEVRY